MKPDPGDPTEWVAGVDGGGTGSRAVALSASGETLARAAGRAALVKPGEEDRALEAILELVTRLTTQAGREDLPDRLLLGLAGVGRRTTRARFQERVARAGVARGVEVRTDVEVAFHDAFGDGAGVLLVGGTGSVAIGRTPDGRDLRSGGWGAVVGDEGSGWWMGLAALRAVFQAVDGRGPSTVLVDIVLSHFGVEDHWALMDRMWAVEKREVAALVPGMVEAADSGDAVARRILSEAAGMLADHLVPLIRSWRGGAPPTARGRARSPSSAEGAEGDPVPVALVGGLVAPGGPLRARLLPRIQCLGGAVIRGVPDPAMGAARWALKGPP